VYSIGVLLWQISSGYNPFYKVDHDASLVLSILNGKEKKLLVELPLNIVTCVEVIIN
jgi:hypothetical protein